MTGVESPSTAKSGSHRWSSALARPVAAALLAVVTAITAVVTAWPSPAGADQIADLQAQAARLSQQLVEGQLQLDAYDRQYAAAAGQVARDGQRIAATQRQVASDRQRVDLERLRLRREAIAEYMDAGQGTSRTAIFGPGDGTADARAEYRQAIFGNVGTTVAQLRTAESVLQAHVASLRSQQQQDQATRDQMAGFAQMARQAQGALEANRSEVVGELAVAVQRQQQAQAEAAAEAVRAAQARAAASARGAAASVASAGGADSALNPFLRCVLQAESSGNYGAVSPSGTYMGAFQFSQSTWNQSAELAGRPDLVGVAPNQASKADQDALAVALYAADGERPWYDPCRSGG